MKARDIPNILSIFRIVLTVPIVWLLAKQYYTWALLLFVVAGVSDALDGYLAKRFDWTSRLGSFLDPLADKFLLVSSYLVLGWLEVLPAWLVIAVIARDIIIVLGAFAYHFMIGTYDMAPTIISKINTFLQIILVFALVVSLSVVPLPDGLLMAMIYIVFGAAVLSGADYVWTWGRKAYAEHLRTNR